MRALIGLGDHKYYKDGMSHLVTEMSEVVTFPTCLYGLLVDKDLCMQSRWTRSVLAGVEGYFHLSFHF